MGKNSRGKVSPAGRNTRERIACESIPSAVCTVIRMLPVTALAQYKEQIYCVEETSFLYGRHGDPYNRGRSLGVRKNTTASYSPSRPLPSEDPISFTLLRLVVIEVIFNVVVVR